MPIKFSNVFYTYSPKSPLAFAALKDINITVNDHSFTALIGQTGSGKSTLVQHINGLLRQNEGTIDVNGFILEAGKKNKKIKELRKNVGLVFQFPEYQLFEETVLKDVMFGPKNFGVNEKEARESAADALSKVSIDKSLWDKSPFELSGGQRRRVAIAGIIALHPQVLILDEPTAGLDPQGAKEIMELFKMIHMSGTTIIMVSHDMNNVLEYCSDVIVMKEGNVVKVSTPIELFKDDDTISSIGIEEPMVISFAKKLIQKGLNIPLDEVKNEETLALLIKKGREAL
ncbi:MAG: energy-coupling factor transporter ATPase [Bacilli bacterium]